jgi:hypothetical protein
MSTEIEERFYVYVYTLRGQTYYTIVQQDLTQREFEDLVGLPQ